MHDLLMVLTNPPAGDEDRFNEWYDGHAVARLSVPGIVSAQRYVAEAGSPQYMASYDLESADVLDTPAYRALRSNRPDGEQEMLDSLPEPPDRRVYRGVEEFVNGGPSPDLPTPDLAANALAVWMSVEDPQDLAAWYAREHIPLLFGVPGWLRCRRFELVSGGGPRFLALHDLASAETVDDRRAESARSTPWRDRVIGYQTAHERRLYRRLRR